MAQEHSQASIEIISAAATGNLGAFAELVQQYRLRVLRIATGVVGSTDAAEDIAQQVFVKIWHKLPVLRPASFESWLYRITINASIDALRRHCDSEPLKDDLYSGASGPEENAIKRTDIERIRAAIARLPDKTRAALVLKEYEGLSYKEIADVLAIPIGTVMSRLHYARQVLRESLADIW